MGNGHHKGRSPRRPTIQHDEYKVLLLGASNSGKSTFLHQMCRLHGDVNEDELKQEILDGAVHAMRDLM